MKKLFNILLLLALFVPLHAQEKVYEESTNGVQAKAKFLDKFSYENYSKSVALSLVSSTKVSQGKEYSVDCYRYQGWGEDPGDFHIVKIRENGKEIYSLENGLGWNNFSSRWKSSNLAFYSVSLDSQTLALFFVGASIMSQPEYLTAIILKNGKATLVFNKQYVIADLVKSNNSELFKLWNDYDDATEKIAPQHTLMVENKAMSFK